MKIDGVRKEWYHPMFVYGKRHFCPKCGRRLTVVKCTRIVNSFSEKAKNYDFSCGNGFFIGNIKFVRVGFRCQTCKKIYTVEEVRQRELSSNFENKI